MNTCIICFEPTNENIMTHYVFQCNCKYDVHPECLAKCERCLTCRGEIRPLPSRTFRICFYILIGPVYCLMILLKGMTFWIVSYIILSEVRTLFLVDN